MQIRALAHLNTTAFTTAVRVISAGDGEVVDLNLVPGIRRSTIPQGEDRSPSQAKNGRTACDATGATRHSPDRERFAGDRYAFGVAACGDVNRVPACCGIHCALYRRM